MTLELLEICEMNSNAWSQAQVFRHTPSLLSKENLHKRLLLFCFFNRWWLFQGQHLKRLARAREYLANFVLAKIRARPPSDPIAPPSSKPLLDQLALIQHSLPLTPNCQTLGLAWLETNTQAVPKLHQLLTKMKDNTVNKCPSSAMIYLSAVDSACKTLILICSWAQGAEQQNEDWCSHGTDVLSMSLLPNFAAVLIAGCHDDCILMALASYPFMAPFEGMRQAILHFCLCIYFSFERIFPHCPYQSQTVKGFRQAKLWSIWLRVKGLCQCQVSAPIWEGHSWPYSCAFLWKCLH